MGRWEKATHALPAVPPGGVHSTEEALVKLMARLAHWLAWPGRLGEARNARGPATLAADGQPAQGW